MDFIFAAIAGTSFSILITIMLIMLIRNAQRGIINHKIYFLPCCQMIFTFISLLLLIFRIQKYDAYSLYLAVGAMCCAILSAINYIMLYYFDTVSLKKQYPEGLLYINAPKYYLIVVSIVSSITISVLLGWFIYICLSIY